MLDFIVIEDDLGESSSLIYRAPTPSKALIFSYKLDLIAIEDVFVKFSVLY